MRTGPDVNWRPAVPGRVRILRWAVALASTAIAIGVIGLWLRMSGGGPGDSASPAVVKTMGSADRVEPLRILNPGAADRPPAGERRVRRQDATVGYESPPPRMQPPPRRGPADY